MIMDATSNKSKIDKRNNNHLMWRVYVVAESKGGDHAQESPTCPQYGHNTQSQWNGYLDVDTSKDGQTEIYKCL